MKKLLTGVVCAAAIAAAAAVLLPITAMKIATGLSKPQAGKREARRRAGAEAPSDRFLAEQNRRVCP